MNPDPTHTFARRRYTHGLQETASAHMQTRTRTRIVVLPFVLAHEGNARVRGTQGIVEKVGSVCPGAQIEGGASERLETGSFAGVSTNATDAR